VYGLAWRLLLPVDHNVSYNLLFLCGYGLLLHLFVARRTDRGTLPDAGVYPHLLMGHLAFGVAGSLMAFYLARGSGITALPHVGAWVFLGMIGLTFAAAQWVYPHEVPAIYRLVGHLAFLAWAWRAFAEMPHGDSLALLVWAVYGLALAYLERDHVLVALPDLLQEVAEWMRVPPGVLLGAGLYLAGIGPWLGLRLIGYHPDPGPLVVLNPRGVVDLLVIGGMVLIARLLPTPTARLLYLLNVHGVVLVWVAREFGRLPQGTGYVLLVWGGYAVALVLAGLWRATPPAIYVGLGTLLLIVGRLLVLDWAGLSQGWRIVLFLSFGVVFLGLSYRLQSWLSARETSAEYRVPSTE
jgi:hypothetical protein